MHLSRQWCHLESHMAKAATFTLDILGECNVSGAFFCVLVVFLSVSRRGLLKADDSSRKHVYCYFLSMGYHFLPASSTKEEE